MSKLLTKVEAGQGISLEKLDLSTGLVAFDNFDPDMPSFIVASPAPHGFKQGHKQGSNALRLIICSRTDIKNCAR